jgi:hypothetical protein
MVLATLIRIEMAYPGVGILAGDNSQYLSIASAHGVIMVFFMAMPLLFGFFTNFLLPTQLGVHDVAFPRMNSAAFWFLPASLIVLCQLVCVDRRYQRMNCFNVRELQSLVRKRFFFELLDPSKATLRLNESVVVSKYLMNSNFINKNPTNFFNFFNVYKNSTKSIKVNNNFMGIDQSTKQTYSNIIDYSTLFNVFNCIQFVLINIILKPAYYTITNIQLNLKNVLNSTNFYKNYTFNFFFLVDNNQKGDINLEQSVTINYLNNTIVCFKSFINTTNTSILENYSNIRYLQSNYPEFLFKIKIGNYLPEKPLLLNFDHLINSIRSKSGQGIKAT